MLVIDSPILWIEKNKHFLQIMNPGKMDKWQNEDSWKHIVLIINQPPIYRIYDQQSHNEYLAATLDNFISLYNLDDETSEWSIKYKGYFPDVLISYIQLFPLNGSLYQMMKSLDILLRRGGKDTTISCTLKNLDTVEYEIQTSNHQESGKIWLNREIVVKGALYD